MDIDDLIMRCKMKKIKKDEIQDIVSNIRDDSDYLYDCLYIVGQMNLFEYEYLFQKYLNHTVRPDVVKLVLLVLCDYWGKTRNYLSYVIKYAENSEWDFTEEVKLVCISIIGKYLFERTNQFRKEEISLIKLLLTIYSSTDSNKDISMEAYRSLCLASGDVSMKLKMGSNFSVDEKIVRWAESLLKSPMTT